MKKSSFFKFLQICWVETIAHGVKPPEEVEAEVEVEAKVDAEVEVNILAQKAFVLWCD